MAQVQNSLQFTVWGATWPGLVAIPDATLKEFLADALPTDLVTSLAVTPDERYQPPDTWQAEVTATWWSPVNG